MKYLYAQKKGVPRRLVATFGSESQLLGLRPLGHAGKSRRAQGEVRARQCAWPATRAGSRPPNRSLRTIPRPSFTILRRACCEPEVGHNPRESRRF